MVYYFTFKVDGEELFRTPISSLQCTDITKRGTRCKRKCVIGSAFCSSHLAYQHHLKIKNSNIEGAGKGLFACDPLDSNSNEILFKKRIKIVSYNGEIINQAELERRYGEFTAPYAVAISENRFEDGARVRGIGSLANIDPGHNNATLSIHRGQVSLKAIKNIRNGDEILLSYGRAYRMHEPGVEHSTTLGR